VVLWATSVLPLWLLVRPVALIIAVTLAVTVTLALVLRDRDRGALAATALVLAAMVQDLRPMAALASVAAVIVIDGSLHRGRPNRFGRPLTRGLSVLGGSLLLVSVATTVQSGAVQGAVAELRAEMDAPRRADAYNSSTPDIFLILLDGYPGDDAMAELDPAYDRDRFANALTDRGFTFARNSRSNYLLTRLTLASMFSGRHLADVPELQRPNENPAEASRTLRDFADDGAIWRQLGAAGMDRFSISSGWAQLGQRRVERVVEPPQLSEFEVVLLRSTGIGTIVGKLAPTAGPTQVADRIRTTLSDAVNIASERHDRPRFVFVHVPAPHEPWVFGADGEINADTPGGYLEKFHGGESLTPEQRVERLAGHLTYLDGLTLDAIDRIRSATPRPTSIVVFSDHGSDVRFDPNNALGSDLNERTSNIVAVLAPGHPDVFPSGSTVVNLLPRLLNAYLGSSLPDQPDTIWAWRGSSVLNFVQIERDAATGSWAPVSGASAASSPAP